MAKTLEEIRAYNRAYSKEYRIRTGYEKKYYQQNKEKKLAYAKAQLNNSDYKKRKSELAKIRNQKNKELGIFLTEDEKKYRKDMAAKDRFEISDSYISSQFFRVSKKFVNPDLIEVKRLQLLIKRELRNEKRI
jgi:hypothetical protein